MNFIIPHHLIKTYFLKLLLLVLFLSSPNSNNIFGQIIIKEKIEIITPYKSNIQKGINAIVSNSHTVKFEMDWDKSNRDGFIRVVYPSNLDHNTTGWIDGGSLDLTVDGFIAPVYIMFQFKVNLYAYEPTTVNYRMFVDGSEVVAGTSILTGRSSSIPYKNVVYFLDEEEDNCEDYACDGSTPKLPEISIENYSEIDWCTPAILNIYPRPAGVFSVYWDYDYFNSDVYDGWRKGLKFLNDFDINACYNSNTSLWQFNINSEVGFKIKTSLNICLNNIKEAHPTATLIHEENDLCLIPETDRAKAIENFIWQMTHYGLDNNELKYILIPTIIAHEEEHERRFKDDIIKIKTKNPNLFTLTIECEPSFSNPKQKAMEFAEKQYREAMNKFQELLKKKFDDDHEAKDENGVALEEYDVQFSNPVKEAFKKYIRLLKNLNYEEDCN